jgi:hypothetical protein
MSDHYKADPEYFTLIFKGDVRKIKENPLYEQTPFGECVGIAVGSLFDERDYWEARALDAENEAAQ